MEINNEPFLYDEETKQKILAFRIRVSKDKRYYPQMLIETNTVKGIMKLWVSVPNKILDHKYEMYNPDSKILALDRIQAYKDYLNSKEEFIEIPLN